MNEVERLLEQRSLQRVEPDAAAAERLLEDATRHLGTAASAIDSGDLAGAYQLAYDAARKAMTALLLSDGLRARGLGAHASLITAVHELHGTRDVEGVLRKMDRMRSTRNQSEYEGQLFSSRQVERDLELARSVVTFVKTEVRS
jgi:uncharacterized protein (UPF0332 family)